MDKFRRCHLPHVSIVMPAHNAAHTLMESVDSVLKQTYGNFELIICNDASTDETPNLLNNIIDDRVKVIHNPRNMGEGATRDTAIESACGVWLAVIDADDAWAPERLEVMLREADESTDIMLFDDIIVCHDTPSGMVPWRELRRKYAFGCNGTDTIDVPTEIFVCEPRLLIKPLLPLVYVKRNNIRHSESRFGADTGFFLQLLSCGLRLRYLPKAMYYYRITTGAMSGVIDRYVLFQEVLGNSICYFEHAPDVQAALRKKISNVIRREHYMSFIWALKRKEVIKALLISYQYPWIIPECVRNLVKSMLYYHIHRIRHGGRSKKSH